MIVGHRINAIGDLHHDSEKLYTDAVVGQADNIIRDLSTAITNLKENWKGADAGVNIKDIIDIHDEIVQVRNDLANLAHDSNAIAVGYRRIQTGNRANLGELNQISVTEKQKDKSNYSDTADTIYITPEAAGGKDLVLSAMNNIDSFVTTAKMYKDAILGNWFEGPGRERADDSFNNFEKNSKAKQQKLEEVAETIAKAIDSYSI